jgi:hypothetical protein
MALPFIFLTFVDAEKVVMQKGVANQGQTP